MEREWLLMGELGECGLEEEIGGEDCVWNGCGGKKKNDCQSQNVLEKKEYKRCVVEKQAC